MEALRALVGGLSPTLRASLFVVLHVPPYVRSHLSEILTAAGPLPACVPQDGECYIEGTIYVAPPDQHMLIERDRVRLVRGPKENRARPAIDPLFRSAAEFHPHRSIGVVLSGLLDDGNAGLWALKKAGGIAVIQKFSDCMYPDMPRNAAASTAIDHEIESKAMGQLFQRLCTSGPVEERGSTGASELHIENAYASLVKVPREELDKFGVPSSIICPLCGGPLWQMNEGPRRFRCHTGHAYSPGTLLEDHREHTERAVAVLLRLLDDEVNLLQHVREKVRGSVEKMHDLDRTEAEARRRATLVRSLLPADPPVKLAD